MVNIALQCGETNEVDAAITLFSLDTIDSKNLKKTNRICCHTAQSAPN
jgi:hypothetical protein